MIAVVQKPVAVVLQKGIVLFCRIPLAVMGKQESSFLIFIKRLQPARVSLPHKYRLPASISAFNNFSLIRPNGLCIAKNTARCTVWPVFVYTLYAFPIRIASQFTKLFSIFASNNFRW